MAEIQGPDGGPLPPVPVADQGVRVRLTPIRGETPHAVLAQALYIPALLGEFEVSEDGAHSDYETVRHGEFSVRRFGSQRNMRSLRTTDLEALTLYWNAAWLHPTQQDPDWVEKKLNAILHARCPVLMLVRLRTIGWDEVLLRMNVTFRSLRMAVRHGEPDTKYWTISTKEWRHTGTGRRGHGLGKVKLPTTHRLREGDSLQSLSKRYFGSAAGWQAIARANGLDKWGKTTALVKAKRYKVGSRIKIPKKPPIAFARPPKPKKGAGTPAASTVRGEDD